MSENLSKKRTPDGNIRRFYIFVKHKKRRRKQFCSRRRGAVGGIRTLARFNPPTPLAGEPLEPLGYYCKCIKSTVNIQLDVLKWRREWDSNPRPFRVTGFQDRLLKPLGHLSSSFPIRSDAYSTIFLPGCQPENKKVLAKTVDRKLCYKYNTVRKCIIRVIRFGEEGRAP